MVERLITAAITLLGSGALAATVTVVVNRKKTRAEGRNEEIKGELQIAKAATGLVITLREELDRLALRVTSLEEKNTDLRIELKHLHEENRALKLELEDLKR